MNNNLHLYLDREARLDTVVGEDKRYWQLLGRIADDWQGADRGKYGVSIDTDAFGDWCEEQHGFRAVYEDGGITGQPDIKDLKKYTLCLLKYSG